MSENSLIDSIEGYQVTITEYLNAKELRYSLRLPGNVDERFWPFSDANVKHLNNFP